MLNISQIVHNIIEKYNTDDPFIIAKKLGYSIKKCDLNNYNGKYTSINNNTTLFVNKSLNIVESLITCAHELGYSFLYPKKNAFFISNTTSTNITNEEANCNSFALALLIENSYNFEDNYNPLTTLALIKGIKTESIIK